MKKFIKENWFKISIITIFIIIALPIAYYFIILLPKRNLMELQQQKQQVDAQLQLQKAKQAADQQAAQVKAQQDEQDKQAADQQTANQQVAATKKEQANQAASTKKATDIQKSLAACVNITYEMMAHDIKIGIYDANDEQRLENLRNMCYHVQ